jgi:hypothetical protein
MGVTAAIGLVGCSGSSEAGAIETRMRAPMPPVQPSLPDLGPPPKSTPPIPSEPATSMPAASTQAPSPPADGPPILTGGPCSADNWCRIDTPFDVVNAVRGAGNEIWIGGTDAPKAHNVAVLRDSVWTKYSTGSLTDSLWVGSGNEVWITDANGSTTRIAGTFFDEQDWFKRYRHLWGFAPNDLWATTDGPGAEHYDGLVWTSTPLPPNLEAVRAFWGAATSNVWAVGVATGTSGPESAMLHWDGRAWSRAMLPADAAATANGLAAVWGSVADDVWATGAGVGPGAAALLHFDGNAWQIAPNPPNAKGGAWTGVFGSAANDVWIVSDAGAIGHFDGRTWHSEDGAFAAPLRAVWTNGREVWAGGDGGLERRVILGPASR